MSIVPEIERQLRDAAERLSQSPLSRAAGRARRLRGRLLARPMLVGLLLVTSASGVALAARALVGVGSPAPREYPNLGARILPAGTRLLALRVADPAGGPPWGMRLIFTTADRSDPARSGEDVRWGCVQIGRVVDGRLGALGQDGAFHDDGLFHELPVQPESCGAVHRAGALVGLTGGSNIEVASAYQGLHGCVTEAVRRQQSIALQSIRRQLAVAKAESEEAAVRAERESLATYRRIAPQIKAEPSCPFSDLRHIAFGIAGPNARSVTVTGDGINQTIVLSPADDGAYLIVQHEAQLQHVISMLKSEDLALQARALHVSVHYENSHSCRPGSTPACLAPLGSVHAGPRPPSPIRARESPQPPPPAAPETPLSRQAERNPATPNPVTITPASGGPHTAFKLAFHALLNGGGYSYLIKANGPRRCQRAAELATGGDGVAIGETPIVRGQTVTKTLAPPPHGLCPGSYRIYVAFFNPEGDALENFPFAAVLFTVTR